MVAGESGRPAAAAARARAAASAAADSDGAHAVVAGNLRQRGSMARSWSAVTVSGGGGALATGSTAGDQLVQSLQSLQCLLLSSSPAAAPGPAPWAMQCAQLQPASQPPVANRLWPVVIISRQQLQVSHEQQPAHARLLLVCWCSGGLAVWRCSPRMGSSLEARVRRSHRCLACQAQHEHTPKLLLHAGPAFGAPGFAARPAAPGLQGTAAATTAPARAACTA